VIEVEGGSEDDMAWCREQLAKPREVLDPPPLLTGEDLLHHGMISGPIFRTILERVRDAQLDGHLRTKADALSLADRILHGREPW
jgi:poly(A) polymerase